MSWFTLAGTVMIVWGMPIEGYNGPDAVVQAFVCKSGDLWVMHDCLAYGQASTSMAECVKTHRMALQDHPEMWRGGCLWVRPKDLARRPGEH